MSGEYVVTFETRERGALGRFDHTMRNVLAINRQDAVAKAFIALHAEGLETRFGVACEFVRLVEVREHA